MENKTIPLFKVYVSEEVDKPLLETIHSGWIGEGPRVVEFEANLKAYTGNDKLVTLNAGTSALHLAYHMALHPNDYKGYRNSNVDEIISTPITCTATNTPILSSVADKPIKVLDEFKDLRVKYKDSKDANEFNLETLDLFLKYDITSTDTVNSLIESGKLKINGIDEVLEKYEN